MKQKTPLILVCGPTASGKTRLGIALAKKLDGEVVSADSMQLYRGMDIGTAKPSLEEQEGIRHHMLSVCAPEESYSLARYAQEAGACVEDILARGKQPIVVGGTGLYIRALLRGPAFGGSEENPALRQELESRLKREGILPLHEDLARRDPVSAARLHQNDRRRILRALEVVLSSGKTITEYNAQEAARPPRFASLGLALSFKERADLYARIDARVEEMLRQGLLEELQRLRARGLSPTATAMQAIAYKELLPYVQGACSLDAATSELKLRSRQYAKRQLSWFRRQPELHWILWDKSPDFSFGLQNSLSFLLAQGVR